MMQSLASILRQHRTTALIEQAETIRDFRDCDERTELANQQVREAMYQQAIGRIDQQAQFRIFTILSFVMPSNAPCNEDEPPLPEHEESELRNAELLEQLRCQLDRQNCPTCGEEPFQV